MTPAVVAARKSGLRFTLHEFEVEQATGFGVEAARALGLPAERVFKTLVARIDGQRLVTALVPVGGQLSLKSLARLAGGKRAVMAEPAEAERATGYVVGGISPLGQRRRLGTFVDRSALEHATVYVSGGRRGLEIELAPDDLVSACNAIVGAIGPA